jgi:NHS family nucleoside permease-like MFS transporter
MLLGVSLQITNGFANPYISSFATIKEYAGTFGVNHANILISLSQISETCCILLIPFFMKRFGIKNVMLIAMFAWVLRFGLFGVGNPGSGVWMFVLSMIVYGVAFDFFNISGSLFVDKSTNPNIRSSAQGLFMLMTNGIGATVGTLSAQAVVNHFTRSQALDGNFYTVGDWQSVWFIFASYALIVGVLFALCFKQQKKV